MKSFFLGCLLSLSAAFANTPPQVINITCPSGRWLNSIIPGQPATCATASYSEIIGLPVQAGNSGKFLSTDGSAATWSAQGNGINQLTGDVLAGPGTGSQAATVASIGGVASSVVAYMSGATGNIQIQLNGKQGTGNYLTDISGDLSATGPGAVAGTVNSVGGSSAANVHAAELLANAATSANTANAIVKRDGSGAFAGSLTGAASLNVLKGGDTMTGPLVINYATPHLDMSGPAGAVRDLRFQTALSNRWIVRTNGTAESGSNAGSDFEIGARDDSGASIDTPLSIARAAGGAVTIPRPIVASGGITGSLAGAASSNVLKVGDTMTGGLQAPSIIVTGLSPSRIVLSDSSKNLISSTTGVGDTELGYLLGVTSAIQTQLNAKEPTQTKGTISTSTTGVTVGNGSSSTVGPNVTVNVSTAAAGQNGLLSGTDWSTFNSKQAAGNYMTALTSDVSASGPGSAAATVNSVGGSSASNINAAELLANAATSSNTNNAIVKRGASGEFSAGAISATGTVTGSNLSGTNTGNVTLGTANGLSLVGQALSLGLADTSNNGALSSTDWTTFNSKQAAGNYLTGLSSDVSASGPGVAGATVNSVGGSTAANVHAGELLANAATSANTVSTIVKRDGSGVFAGTLTGAASLNVLKAGDTMTGVLQAPTVNVSGLTASRLLFTDGSKNLISATSAVTDTKLGYLAAVTADTLKYTNLLSSDAQTQIDSKVIRAGDTMTGTLQVPTLNVSGLTATRFALTDGSKNLASSTNAVTDTEFGRLIGVTSGIQSQIDGKQATGNYVTALTGDVSASGPGSVASTVNSVGGSTAANVHAAELAANAATNANTVSTLVKRDSSGNFSAGSITASLIGAASLNVQLAGDTMTGALTGTTILEGAGSQTNPSITFSGDPDTGLYNPTGNAIAFTSGGARKMRVTSTGLGIGIDTPLTNLDISTDFADRLSSVTSVGAITALVTTNSSIRLTGASGVTVSGAASPTAGKFLIVHNTLASGAATFLNENAAATASQRFTMSGGRDADLPLNAAFMFQYDDTASRWHQIGDANDRVFRAGDTMTGALVINKDGTSGSGAMTLNPVVSTNSTSLVLNNGGSGVADVAIEGATAGTFMTGTSANAMVVGTTSTRVLQFATNNNVRLTMATGGDLTLAKSDPKITLNNTGTSDSPYVQGGTGGNGRAILSGGSSRGVDLAYNAGTAALTVYDTNGKVNINSTSAPTHRLTVNDSADQLALYNTGAGVERLLVNTDSSGATFKSTNTGGTGLPYIFKGNTAEYGRISSSGVGISGSTSGSVTLAAPAVAGTQTYTLPSAVPTGDNQMLFSTTAGVMSWAAGGPYDYTTPLTAGTVTIPDNVSAEIIDPAGTIAVLVLNMPATPVDRQRMDITCGQTVTAITHNGNGSTLKGGLTTCNASSGGRWIYRSASTTWYRIN